MSERWEPKKPYRLWTEGPPDEGMLFLTNPDGSDIPMGVAPLNLPEAQWIEETLNAAICPDETPLLWKEPRAAIRGES